ncbi:MAG: OmpL47-type beta-barrel domain-containing protein [Candidatus Bathyarchaeia archaeon]
MQNAKRHCLTAVALLVGLFLSVFAPMAANAIDVVEPAAATMYKSEDIFLGTFSPQEVSIAVGQETDISFSICPSINLPDVVIRFYVPTDFFKLTKGESVWTGSAKRNETKTVQFSIVAQHEVDMNIRAYVEASPEGKKYSSSYCLRVTSMSPQNAGEDNVQLIQVSPPVNQSGSGSAGPAGTITIMGTLGYINEFGTSSRMRCVLVELWDADTGPDEHVASDWTDYAGFFSFTVNNDDGWLQGGRDPYFKVISEGTWDWITESGGFSSRYAAESWQAGSDVPDGFTFDYGFMVPSAYNEAWEAGDAVLSEANWIRTWVGWERPSKVTIYWPEEDWPASYGDYIVLPQKTTVNWGHVTVHHEYAHSVMWDLYGNSWPPGFEGGGHTVPMEDVMPDAYVEGWAEFMQCAVDNNANNLLDSGMDIETNAWYNVQDTGTMDGQYIEGEVASILWDIIDPAGPEWGWDKNWNSVTWTDSMAWGFDKIFWIIHDHYSSIDSIQGFWTQWGTHYPTLSTSVGPLCSIYWHYGIDHDVYAPTGSIVINADNTYTGRRTVTLTLSGEDWGGGVTEMRFSEDWGSTWGSWNSYQGTWTFVLSTAGDGLKYVDVQFKDAKGQTSVAGSIYDGISLDTTDPTGSIVINSGNPTYTSSRSVTLYLTYYDETSGVYKVRCSNQHFWGNETFEPPTSTKAWTLTAGDGYKVVYYEIMDNIWLISDEYSDSIILDTVAPVTTISHSAGSSTIALSATDSVSGIKTTYYRIDSGPWWTYTGPFNLAGLGTHTIDYYSQDNAGNNEAAKQLKVHYLNVNTEPSGILLISGSGYYDHGTNGTTGKAPATVVSNGTIYAFSTWKKDGTPVSGNPISVLMDAPHTATASYVVQPTYSATIKAHCNDEAIDVNVAITKDGSPSGYNTPCTFSGLTGTHTFTVPATDSNGHPFKQWTTGETTTTITVAPAGGTYTAIYESPPPPPSIAIWTDKTTYRIGDTMKVYVRVTNPGSAVPVRATIVLQLPNGNPYGPLLDMTVTVPAGYDSGNVLWNQFTIPTAPVGNYKWIAELRKPSTGGLISRGTWDWTLTLK